MKRAALLIGVSEYGHDLHTLSSPAEDVLAMQRVLQHPEVGGFLEHDVTVLINRERQEIEEAIYLLFADSDRDDLLLLYFSGHGLKDDAGSLFLATPETRKSRGKLVKPTAVSARTLHDSMTESRSEHQVLILDCCFSGAIAKGLSVKDDGRIDFEAQLGGKGRAILTSSNSIQYAFHQDGFKLSTYTHYLVEGLEKGAADRDEDGWISVDELHDYVRDKVHQATPAMTPQFFPVQEGHKILLARSPKDDPKLYYRKQVELLSQEDNGEFSDINRCYLDELQTKLDITQEVAAAIEAEELEPFRQRQAKIERYQQVFGKTVQHGYPIDEKERHQLKRFQQILGLRDQDIAAIEAPIAAKKEAEYQAKLQDYEDTLKEIVQTKTTELTFHDLDDYQRSLGLRDEDVAGIRSRWLRGG